MPAWTTDFEKTSAGLGGLGKALFSRPGMLAAGAGAGLLGAGALAKRKYGPSMEFAKSTGMSPEDMNRLAKVFKPLAPALGFMGQYAANPARIPRDIFTYQGEGGGRRFRKASLALIIPLLLALRGMRQRKMQTQAAPRYPSYAPMFAPMGM